MMHMAKIFPIHSKEEQKGRRKAITDKIKRNTSCISAQETRSIVQSNKKSANLVQRKPKTAMVTVRNCNTTAANFITSYNVWDQPPTSQRHQQFQMDGSESRRKSSYLSRRFIHKKMLESYLDNVFHKVSLIRASQEKPINVLSRGKGRRSLISTTR